MKESVTPTSSMQPTIMEEDAIVEMKIAAETPPVQEIKFQTNPYTSTAASATPSLPPTVLGYASPYTTAPIETAGTIYHTGVNI